MHRRTPVIASRELASGQFELEIAGEWDANVEARARELELGRDLTHSRVIVPTIVSTLVGAGDIRSVIDVGCGLGFLTSQLRANGFDMTGVDISARSIDYAGRRFDNVKFACADVIQFSIKHGGAYDTCVANMVLHNVWRLRDVLASIHRMLRPGGTLVATLPHPTSWPARWGIPQHVGFNYHAQAAFKVPFKIRRGAMHPSKITYVHRSQAAYVDALLATGFELTQFLEPPTPGRLTSPDLLLLVARTR